MDLNSKAEVQPPDPCKKLSDAWFKPVWFAMILAGLIVAFFPDLLLGGKSPVFRDFGIFTYPNALFQRESFWHGEIPLWNPLNNCGIPFLAQWNTTALYPPSLVYLLLPVAQGLDLFLLLHLFLGRLGDVFPGFALDREPAGGHRCRRGLYIQWHTLNSLMWTSNLAALAWMPWVILVVEQAWLPGGKRIVPAVFAGTIQMLAGAPEIIFFTWLILFALGWKAGGRQSGTQSSLRTRDFDGDHGELVERRATAAVF